MMLDKNIEFKIDESPAQLIGVNKLNLIIGKNGCGKSYLLRKLDEHLRQPGTESGKVGYVSPERGGIIEYNAGIEDAMAKDINWLPKQRRTNQAQNFRAQSAVRYRTLEYNVLRQIERRQEDSENSQPLYFDKHVQRLNTLLDRVELRRTDKHFSIHKRSQPESEVQLKDLSSGESELISLAVEILCFIEERAVGKTNFLLLDEPDVHLHPDLQERLILFLSQAIEETGKDVCVFIATHSTVMISAVSRTECASISFKNNDNTLLKFKPINQQLKLILPVFGAHPLTRIYAESPILLLEGEDDVRIWQQAVRSSEQKLQVHPCACGGISQIKQHEREITELIKAVYEGVPAYSLRDQDDTTPQIDDEGAVIRMKLDCRTSENLILTDDVLKQAGTTWKDLCSEIQKLSESDSQHPKIADLRAFVKGGMDRKQSNLKKIMTILVGFITEYSWQDLIGKSIGKLLLTELSSEPQENSLESYLGEKVCQQLLSQKNTVGQ